jgi:hypothetical protein
MKLIIQQIVSIINVESGDKNLPIVDSPELSPREHILLENERDEARLVREHQVTLKRLELEIVREKSQAQIELRRLEAKWSSWLALPKTFIKLPVYLLFGLGYIVHAAKKQEPSKSFWRFLQ